MSYTTVLSAKAMRELDRLDRKIEQRVQSRLDELAANPLDPRISNNLEMSEGKRYSRVGDWRIVYDIKESEKTLFVITIQHRSRVYKELTK
ncbi:MAG: type II toxin-antitoxin system RelE/ParE family toxin [Deltaproteobacteria bacterium]|nr:type II toxin-antitoxin system RelE/ParE family toxin [Deltaproteobacteria bacterium]